MAELGFKPMGSGPKAHVLKDPQVVAGVDRCQNHLRLGYNNKGPGPTKFGNHGTVLSCLDLESSSYRTALPGCVLSLQVRRDTLACARWSSRGPLGLSRPYLAPEILTSAGSGICLWKLLSSYYLRLT